MVDATIPHHTPPGHWSSLPGSWLLYHSSSSSAVLLRSPSRLNRESWSTLSNASGRQIQTRRPVGPVSVHASERIVPPMRPESETEWWGERKGRVVTRAALTDGYPWQTGDSR